MNDGFHYVFIRKSLIGTREALIGRWTHVGRPGRLRCDWSCGRLDPCKQRRLDDLLDLYDASATVECCEGGSFRGRSEMEIYWAPRLARSRRGAFEIDALMPKLDGVTLDYRGYDGVPVLTHFRFTSTRKISITACALNPQAIALFE